VGINFLFKKDLIFRGIIGGRGIVKGEGGKRGYFLFKGILFFYKG